MTGIEKRHSNEAQGSTESRAAERYSLVLRSAKLITPWGETVCILRDVSATGVKVRLFHPLPQSETLHLELGNGDRYSLEPVWQNEDHAGLRLLPGPVDVAGLIAEQSELPKRNLRLTVDWPVSLCWNELRHDALMRNISQSGVKIRSETRLAIGQQVRLESEGLFSRYAKVRWRRHPDYGLVFEETFRLDELALLSERINAKRAQSEASSRLDRRSA